MTLQLLRESRLVSWISLSQAAMLTVGQHGPGRPGFRSAVAAPAAPSHPAPAPRLGPAGSRAAAFAVAFDSTERTSWDRLAETLNVGPVSASVSALGVAEWRSSPLLF